MAKRGPTPRRTGGHEVVSLGFEYSPTPRIRLADPGDGLHCWTAIASFRLSEKAARDAMRPGQRVLLDQENLAEFHIGCFKCEKPFDELAGAGFPPCDGSIDDPMPAPPSEWDLSGGARLEGLEQSVVGLNEALRRYGALAVETGWRAGPDGEDPVGTDPTTWYCEARMPDRLIVKERRSDPLAEHGLSHPRAQLEAMADVVRELGGRVRLETRP